MFTLEMPRIIRIDQIPGWCDSRMMKKLQELARGLQVVVNVGAWKGKSCAALAQECAGIVWAIDHWQGSPEEVDGTVSTDHIQARDNPLSVYLEFCQYMLRFGLLGTKVIPITGDSCCVAAGYFKANSVDLVYIDGAHDHLSVWRDLECWTGRVRRGGTLCGDDYNWKDVKRAVDRFHQTYRAIHGLGDLEIEFDERFWLVRRLP